MGLESALNIPQKFDGSRLRLSRCTPGLRTGEQRKRAVERAVMTISVHLIEQQIVPDVALQVADGSERKQGAAKATRRTHRVGLDAAPDTGIVFDASIKALLVGVVGEAGKHVKHA